MFPYQISDRGVTVFIDSKPRQFAVTHSQYPLIVEAIHAGDEVSVRLHTDVAKSINLQTSGRVRIEDDHVFVGDREVHGNIVDRILAMVALKSKAVDGLIKFLDRVHDNVSKSVLDELFDFIEACDLPMTDDGCFLTYKFVRADFTDCHTGTFDNSVGQSPEMPRNEVDDRRNVTCSDGLHVCSLQYLGSGHWGKRVVVCKVAPEDVVSVPLEYGNAKMRVCKYTVVDCIDFDNGERLTPWFDDQYDTPESDDSEGEDEVELEQPPYALVTDDEDGGVNSDILLFDPDTVAASLDALGADETAIQTYLETLDDELVESLHDWDVITGSDGDVQVTIWLADEVIGLEHTVMVERAPVPATDVASDTPKKGSAKLTVDQVREIKALKDEWAAGNITLTAIGKQYGVHREQIARIFRGDTWSHIT